MLQSRTVELAKGGDGAFRWSDPFGSFHRATLMFSPVAPVVNTVTAQDTMPPLGQICAIQFTSTQPGAWSVAYGPDDAFPVPGIDGLSCTVYFTPSLVRATRGTYIGARCRNAAGEHEAYCRVHPGVTGVVRVGVGAGWDYPNLTAAFAAVKALPNPTGWSFVIQDQTINAAQDDMHIYRNGYTSVNANLPPPGTYTTSTSGADPVYTFTRLTTVMAESPLNVQYDGGGTRTRAIDLWGGTSLETYERTVNGWNNGGCVAAVECRGILILGFFAKNYTDAGVHIFHCDHIIVEGCVGIDGSNDSQPIRAANSTDILFVNTWATGRGRYKQGFYQCKRTRQIRGFSQEQQITAGSPRGRFVEYHLQDHHAANLLEWDNDQDDFWTLAGWQDSGMLTLAHTDWYGYGTNWRHRHCLSYNSRMGMLLNDQRTIPTEQSYVFEDMTAWRMRLRDGAGAIGQNGPCNFRRVTAAHIDLNGSSGYANFIWEPNFHHVRDFIIHRYGYNNAGVAATSGNLIYSFSESQPVTYEDGTIFDVPAGINERQGTQTSTSIQFINVDKLTDPTTQGMRYPTRIEPGSNYDLIGRGASNFARAEGNKDCFFGETGYLDELTVNWQERSFYTKALEFFRAYSYTGPRVSGGTGTLTGNRGGNMSDKMLFDYINSDNGRDVPPPRTLTAAKNGGVLQVSWFLFAAAYQATVTAWELWIDGSLAQSCAATIHAALFAGMVTGRTYRIRVRAVDSVHGTSGFSDELTVVM